MDNLRPIISGVLGGVIAAVLLVWMLRKARSEGAIEYGWRVRLVSLVTLAIALFIGYAALHASRSQVVLAYAIGGTSVVISLWFVLESFFVGARVSASHLEIWSPWRAKRRIPWAAISGYRFSGASGSHILYTEGHGTVRLSTLLDGLEEIRSRIEQLQAMP